MSQSMQQSHEPQLLRELRQKALTLTSKIESLSKTIRQKSETQQKLQSQLSQITDQVDIQNKKHRSLIVLLNQLQQTYHNQYLQKKQQQQTDQIVLASQNSMLRFLLVQETQNVKQCQKLINFFKHALLDKNKGRVREFMRKSNFIQGQSQLIAKLKSQINLFKNNNLQCKRKWYSLQQQSKNLQSHNKLLSVQNQRQKVQIKALYQQYLTRMNQAKQRIVSFNQTQKQSTINQYFVKQIAILQQARQQIQEQSANLEYHRQSLKQQLQRIQIQNREFLNFFNQPGQQGTLAHKMKKRIQQLRDVLLQCKKKSKNTRGVKLRKIAQSVKTNYSMLFESNDYVELKTREQKSLGSFLQQKPIADFFNNLLEQKDKTIRVLQQQQSSLLESIKQLQVQKQLLGSQIENLQQNLNFDSWQTKFSQKNNWSNIKPEYSSKLKQKTSSQIQVQNNETQNQIYNSYQKQSLNSYSNNNFTFDRRKY